MLKFAIDEPKGIRLAAVQLMAIRIDRHRILTTVQPINWWRAFFVGMVGCSLMMAFIDCFKMLDVTPFSYEVFLGSLMTGERYGAHNWTLGFFINLVVGGLFGILYGYVFEYFFFRSRVSDGLFVGLGHAVLAAVAFFPFFNIMHEQVNTGLYPSFGFFGAGLNPATPILLLVGNLLFGITMGLLYGPVRAERIRMREFEPGENGMPGDRYVITEEEDPEDRRLETAV